MRPLLPCLLASTLAACGASVAVPASPDAGEVFDVPKNPDVATAPDVPTTPDVARATDVPAPQDVVTTPTCPPLEGRWVGWWSYTESGHGEMRSNIEVRFGGAGVTGRGIRPSGDIVDGSLGRDGAVRFTVRASPHDVGFGFTGTLGDGCAVMRGRYASHFYGGGFELQRVVCAAPTRELALDGEAVVDNLTNAPIAVIGACDRTDPVQHHVFALRVARAATVSLTAESDDPTARGIALTLDAGCAAPEVACVGANAALRAPLAAGTYRVVVSTRINRWIPYRLRAVTAR